MPGAAWTRYEATTVIAARCDHPGACQDHDPAVGPNVEPLVLIWPRPRVGLIQTPAEPSRCSWPDGSPQSDAHRRRAATHGAHGRDCRQLAPIGSMAPVLMLPAWATHDGRADPGVRQVPPFEVGGHHSPPFGIDSDPRSMNRVPRPQQSLSGEELRTCTSSPTTRRIGR